MTEAVAKRPGVVYTRPDLADAFVARSLRYWREHNGHTPVVLDPACGEGALMAAARRAGVREVYGMDIDPVALSHAAKYGDVAEGDSLFVDPPCDRVDIVIMNPPWIGQVSRNLGSEYAKRVAKRFAPYHAGADLCAAFVRRATELSHWVSALLTNTAWQGKTYRSGIRHAMKEDGWCQLHFLSEHRQRHGKPASLKWPEGASVHYAELHMVEAHQPRKLWTPGLEWYPLAGQHIDVNPDYDPSTPRPYFLPPDWSPRTEDDTEAD